MTFQEAAMEVLRRVGKPLPAQKIAQLAVKHNLLTVVGKTPEDTMASRLDVATRDQYASDSPFVRTAKAGVYSLREWGGNPPGPPAGGGFEEVPEGARPDSASAKAERAERGGRGERAAGSGGAEAADAEGEARGDDRDGRGKRRRRGGRGGKGRAGAGAAAVTENPTSRTAKEPQPPRERPGRDARPAKREPASETDEAGEVDAGDEATESLELGEGAAADSTGLSADDRRRGRRGRRGGRRRRGRGAEAPAPAGAQAGTPGGDPGRSHGSRAGQSPVRAFAGSGGGNGHSLGARNAVPSLPPMAGGGGTPARLLASAGFGAVGEDALPELSGPPPAYGAPQTAPAFPVGSGSPGAPAADVPAGAARIPSLVDAAYVVMRSSGARAPLHFHRIAELGRAAGLRASGPAIHAAILADNERRAARGLTPLFAPGQKGEWALSEWALPDRVARLEQRLWELTREMRAATQAEIAVQLRTFDAASFQQLMALLLERQGYGDIRLASRSSEGNVALAATLHHGLARVGTALVLRTGGGPATREHVRDLRARLDQLSASQGVILALSGVSSDARLEADAPGPPVRILDADEIAELLVSVQLGVSIGHVRVVRPDLDFFNELRRR